MNQKRLPITQDPLKVTNKNIFAYRLWHREHQRDVRRNQINLRVVFLSKLIDAARLNTGVMNQSINHSDEDLNATAARRDGVRESVLPEWDCVTCPGTA